MMIAKTSSAMKTLGGRGTLTFSLILFLILISVCITGCGSNKSMKNSAANANSSGTSQAETSSMEMADQYSGESDLDSGSAKASADRAESSEMLSKESPQSSGISPDMGSESFNHKLIYKAHLAMEVEDYAIAQTVLRDYIHVSGGYILEFSDQKSLHEEGGTFVIKVPSNGFFSFINELEKMKPLSLQRNVSGQDVTEEYIDLAARLKAKQVVEERLLAFMEKAEKVDDLVKFSNELARVQEEIELIQGRTRYLDQNVAHSTVEIRMYERLDAAKGNVGLNGQKPAIDRAWKAMQSSVAFINRLFEGVLIIAAGAIPVIILISVFIVPAMYIYYRRKRSAEASRLERANLFREENRNQDSKQ